MAAYARRMFAGGSIVTTVPLSIGASDSSFTLAASTNWPDGSSGNFMVVLDFGNSTQEKVLCSSRSGLVVTVAASGRGDDGTTGVAHSAGTSIQCCHGAQDDDEANQLVANTLGLASLAKGDIYTVLSAAGPNTLTRVGLGSTGMNLGVGGSALPAYEVVPGRLLATTNVTASHSYSVASTTPTALDTTNATISFTVPASGNVDINVSGVGAISEGAASPLTTLALMLLNHSGGTQVGSNAEALSNGADSTTGVTGFFARFHLTGLTPGALQLDLAAAVSATSGITATIATNAFTGAPAAGAAQPLLIQAFAA